jgi:hypothetical protein
MKQLCLHLSVIIVLLCIGCSQSGEDTSGNTSLPSWIDATAGFFESERCLVGDTITLSRDYFLRLHLLSEARRCFGNTDTHFSLAGTPEMVMQMMTRHGALTANSYCPRHGQVNYQVLARKVETAVRSSRSVDEAEQRAADIIDIAIEYMPRMVFLLGAEYTPLEYAHSVALESDYEWITTPPADGWAALIKRSGHAVWYGKAPNSVAKKVRSRGEDDFVSLHIKSSGSDADDFQIVADSIADNTIKASWVNEKTLGVFIKK